MAGVKERVQKWDILKFVLVFFVVLGHICELYTGTKGIFMFIYSFHMPLFIFISGLFSKKTINEKRYDKIFIYFVLYIFIKTVTFFGRVISQGKFAFSVFSENGVPWYAFAIFAFYLITIFLKNFPVRYILIFSIALACFAGYDKELSIFLSISRIIVFYPFFYAGYILNPDTVSKKLSSKPVKIIAVLFIIALIVFIYFKLPSIEFLLPMLSGKNSFFTLKRYQELGGVFRLCYYAYAFVLGAMIIALIPNKLGKGTVAKLGSRSVQVYALHYFFIYLIYKKYDFIGWADSIYPNLSRILILPISIALLLICSLKIWEPIFNFILKPKIKTLK